MTELLFPSLTGTKTDCLFEKVGLIFSVLIKVLWLTSPTGTCKQLVHAEIALSLVACPKLWTPQPNWLDIFVYRELCPKLWRPQPNWLDIFVYRNLCPKLWTSCLTGSIYLCRGIHIKHCGLPCLTGMMCLFMMIFV